MIPEKQPAKVERRCIVTVVNDDYAEPALVFLYSLKRHGMLAGVDLVILSAPSHRPGSLTLANQKRIDDVAPAHFVAVQNLDLYLQYIEKSPWSEPQFLPAYFSLEVFLNETFEAYETICYLDADMICLKEFWYVFAAYDRAKINGSRTCQTFLGYPNVMTDFYLNTGFFIFNRSMLHEFRRRVQAITLFDAAEYFYGYWDQLIVNKALRHFISLPFHDCNFKPKQAEIEEHRIIHYSGPDWKPWKVRSPSPEYRYLFEPWWKMEAEVLASLEVNMPDGPVFER